jgi:hypothetical protein
MIKPLADNIIVVRLTPRSQRETDPSGSKMGINHSGVDITTHHCERLP